MRLLISNPDAVGDFVLRQPLFQALSGAGHRLMLIVRPGGAALARQVAPGAEVVVCRADPYAPTFPLRELGGGAREADAPPEMSALCDTLMTFNPDRFVCAAHEWSPLEEWLVTRMRRRGAVFGVVAQSGGLKQDPAHAPGAESVLVPDALVEAPTDTPELRKSELIAGELLGRSVQLPDPRMHATEAQLSAADGELMSLGLDPGKYFIACVGHGPVTSNRNLPLKKWGEILARWADAHQRKFLLVGSAEELSAIDKVRRAMKDAGALTARWVGVSEESLSMLVGLTARSAGYVGRDTGPMHIAAALGKPVLAAFGGGTWPRFLPAVTPSVVLTVGVPCVGCDWRCHLSQSYCVRRIPAEAVLRAADDLETGRVHDRRTVIIEPDRMLLAQIGKESAQVSRQRLAQITLMGRQIHGAMDELQRERERGDERIRARDEWAETLDSRIQELRAQASDLRERLAERDRQLEAEGARLSELRSQVERERAELSRRCEQTAAELESERLAHRAEVEDDRRKLDALAGEFAKYREGAQRERSSLEERVGRIEQRAGSLESDREALARLCDQQEHENGVLRSHLDDLLASRWRKLGQRMGIAMTLPWEREERVNSNGRGGNGHGGGGHAGPGSRHA